jgi:hypothetical protein
VANEIRIRIDASPTSAQFRVVKRELNARLRAGMVKGAEKYALPKVLQQAPSVVRPYLTVKAAVTKGAYITTRGPRQGDRITGLLNYGGVVKAPIRPQEAEALAIPGVGLRAAVTGPRHYRGQGFIQKGVLAAKPGLEDAVLEEVMDSFGDLAVAE